MADFDSLNVNNQTHQDDANFPKYIRFSDYHTAWTKGPDNNGGAQLYGEERDLAIKREAKSRKQIESVTDKSTLEQNNRWNDNIGDANRKDSGQDRSKTQLDKSLKTEAGFTCNDKPSGFYPDTDSACRVSIQVSPLDYLILSYVTLTPPSHA